MENTTNTISLSKEDYQSYFENGIDFETYFEQMKSYLAEPNLEDPYFDYTKLNLQRISRILKQIKLDDKWKEVLPLLHHPIKWLVISEFWCGDAAQLLPVLHSIAQASNRKIDLKIVFRDQNLPLIDAHLSFGGRAIPKVIQMDKYHTITGTWGPRPLAVQGLVKKWKEEYETKELFAEQLHKWYFEDKQVSAQKDLFKLINLAIANCPDCKFG
jgi:hypothetical protein